MKFNPEKSKGLFYGSIIIFVLILISCGTIYKLDISSRIKESEVRRGDGQIFRIPKGVIPLKYDLTLKFLIPHLNYTSDDKSMEFEGEVVVKLKTLQKTQNFTLTSQGLIIHKVDVAMGKNRIAKRTLIIHENNIIVSLDRELDKNVIINAKIVYCGDLKTKEKGLYTSNYIDSNGNQKITVLTRNKPNLARTMVPCFDEPEYKTIWNVAIIHPKGTTALSNNDVKYVKNYDESFLITQFLPTPKMSTYLLAIAISDFEFVEKVTRTGVRIRIWSRKEQVSNLNFILSETCRVFERLEKMFKVPYPMSKLDLVGISEYETVKLENWGLMTFDEGFLSFDQSKGTPDKKHYIRSIISHELMHNWIGNLVTVRYWTEIWLIEGITTLFEDFGANYLANGTYDENDNFILNGQRYALALDSPQEYHPLAIDIKPNDAIRSFFNPITYKKAAAVLYMFRKVVGKEVFMEGLRKYVMDNEFSNADDDYLYYKMQQVYDRKNKESLNIASFAQSWTQQIGYPVVKVRRANSTHIELTQELYYGKESSYEILPEYSNPKQGFKWEIPIFYQNSSTKNQIPIWLRDEAVYIESRDGIVINVDSDCYYRVKYYPQIWRDIISNLISDPYFYSARTKLRLIEDAFLFDQGLSIDKYIDKETERLPIEAYISELRKNRKIGNKILRFISKLRVEKSWNYVAQYYNDDTKFHKVSLAISLIKTECEYKSEECVRNSNKYYNELINSCEETSIVSKCSTVPSPLRSIVYCLSLRKDSSENARKRIEKWLSVETSISEKEYLQYSLSSDCLSN